MKKKRYEKIKNRWKDTLEDRFIFNRLFKGNNREKEGKLIFEEIITELSRMENI